MGLHPARVPFREVLSEKHKIPIIDADRIARQAVEPGTKGFNQIVEYFGDKIPDIITEDGTLNRPALGKWVFSHPADLKILNGITHPAVRLAMLEEVMKYYVKGYRMCILDVPLLFEAGLDMFCGVTISVVCDEETQLERLQIRNPTLSKEEARNRISSQMSTRERIGRSDYVIKNDSTLTDLYEKVDSIVKEITRTSVRMLLSTSHRLVSSARRRLCSLGYSSQRYGGDKMCPKFKSNKIKTSKKITFVGPRYTGCDR